MGIFFCTFDQDLFKLQESTLCSTHDLLDCECSGLGQEAGQQDVRADRACQLTAATVSAVNKV